MRIIGVIDLRRGQAVHAQGGRRVGYRPVQAVAGAIVGGDPAALSRVYVERLGIRELYVADLDAIAGGAEQDQATRAIAATGADVWLDAGVATVPQARRAHARGAAHVVVGLETLPSFGVLRDICADAELSEPARESVTGGTISFSLDLRDGKPIAVSPVLREMAPDLLARRAVVAGAGSVIVLDLDRIGSSRCIDITLVERLRATIPGVLLLAGGGVRDAQDLQRLADAGCDAALVATALHTGNVHPARASEPRQP